MIAYTDVAFEIKIVWDTLKGLDLKFGLHANLARRSDSAGNYPVHRLRTLPQRYKPDMDKVISLYAAIEKGHRDVVKRLLAAPLLGGCDLDQDAGYANMLLHVAIEKGHRDVVETLLTVPGVNVNRENWRRMTPLCAAIEKGHRDIVETLLAVRGVNINQAAGCEGVTIPLRLAIEKDHKDIVKRLLAFPAIDVTCDYRLSTPLDYALYATAIDNTKPCRKSIIKMLLRYGTSLGITALYEEEWIFRKVLAHDKKLLANLIVSGFSTQLGDEIDLLDKITDEELRARMKRTRINLIKTVQSLFIEENLGACEVPKRVRLVLNLTNSLKVIKALELTSKDTLDLQIARYKDSSHKKLKSFEEFKSSKDDYIFYLLEKKKPKLFIHDVMFLVVDHLLDQQRIAKIKPRQLGLRRNDTKRDIKRLYFQIEDPYSKLTRFKTQRLEHDWSAQVMTF